jgi:hypothetical protein
MSEKQKLSRRECLVTRTTQKFFSVVPILLCLWMTTPPGNCQFQFQTPWYNPGSYQPINFQHQSHYPSGSLNQYPLSGSQYPLSSPTQYPEVSQTQYPGSTGSQSQYPVISTSQSYFPLASVSQSKYPVVSTSQPPVSSNSQPHYPVISDSKYPVLSGHIQQTVLTEQKPVFQKPIKESVTNQSQLFIGFPLHEKEENQWWLFSPTNSESSPDQLDSGLNQVEQSVGQGQDHKNSHQSPTTTIG